MLEKIPDEIKVIIGLGNPGPEYEKTRHNAGAMFLSRLQKTENFTDFKFDKYADALVSSANQIQKNTVRLLAFPQTFMNNSGKVAAYLIKKEELTPNQLLVVHDDKDFNLGETKLQKEISSAGHKGVQSIIDTLGTANFWRLRIGIGPVPESVPTDVFVLQKFSDDEIAELEKVFERPII